jgi:hypothetical protein
MTGETKIYLAPSTMTDEERQKLCGILRGPDAKYFASRAADEIEQLDAARLNAEYQRDTALAELKDQNGRLEGLAKRVEQLENCVEAWQRM